MIFKAYVFEFKGVEFMVVELEVFLDVGIWYLFVLMYYEDLKEYFNWYDMCKDIKFKVDVSVIGFVF